METRYQSKLAKTQEQLLKLQDIKEEEIKKRKKVSYHNMEKVKQKHEELMAQRLREMKRKKDQTEQNYQNYKSKKLEENRIRAQEAEIRAHEAELKRKKRDEVKGTKDKKSNAKFEQMDKRSIELKKKKEKERLINIELQAIKRREREEEAKRLLRMDEYNRKQDALDKGETALKSHLFNVQT